MYSAIFLREVAFILVPSMMREQVLFLEFLCSILLSELAVCFFVGVVFGA